MESDFDKDHHNLAEGEFGTGVVIAATDIRSISYGNVPELPATGELTVDWSKGYDIEKELGGKINIKNQGTSASCVGNAWSYLSWVLQVIEVMKLTGMTLDELRVNQPQTVEDHSAKSIYSQIFLPTGGAYVSAGGELLTQWGVLTEKKVPSRIDDILPDEKFMRDTTWDNDFSSWQAEKMQNKGYTYVFPFMDEVARAIRNQCGVVMVVAGTNNGTWRTLEPKPPQDGDVIWNHLIYCGKFGEDEKGKYIATPNSWGDLGGWQKLREDYFKSHVILVATLVDKPSTNTVRLFFIDRNTHKPIYRDLPINQVDQIKGFTESGWSFKVIPGAVFG